MNIPESVLSKILNTVLEEYYLLSTVTSALTNCVVFSHRQRSAISEIQMG